MRDGEGAVQGEHSRPDEVGRAHQSSRLTCYVPRGSAVLKAREEVEAPDRGDVVIDALLQGAFM